MKLEPSMQADAVEALTSFFLAKLSDRSTASELLAMAQSEKLWGGGHELFQRIREKTLDVENASRRFFQLKRKQLKILECQYCFEEVCAKTLYNLSGLDAPFDEDSPEWIVPNALELARLLDVKDEDILKLVAF